MRIGGFGCFVRIGVFRVVKQDDGGGLRPRDGSVLRGKEINPSPLRMLKPIFIPN